jgi:hypothetical protein
LGRIIEDGPSPPTAMGCQGGVTLDEMSHLEAPTLIYFEKIKKEHHREIKISSSATPSICLF